MNKYINWEYVELWLSIILNKICLDSDTCIYIVKMLIGNWMWYENELYRLWKWWMVDWLNMRITLLNMNWPLCDAKMKWSMYINVLLWMIWQVRDVVWYIHNMYIYIYCENVV